MPQNIGGSNPHRKKVSTPLFLVLLNTKFCINKKKVQIAFLSFKVFRKIFVAFSGKNTGCERKKSAYILTVYKEARKDIFNSASGILN
jgi:hypothetical protein